MKREDSARRISDLRRFAGGDGDVAIMLHPDPDPDALASALALRVLLQREAHSTPIVTLGEMTRPENRRMAELLRMRVTVVTQEELDRIERVIAVDFHPEFSAPENRPRLAIIDHHPYETLEPTDFADVRPSYGATATIMTEYLRADDDKRISEPLATALLYGIKTDTDSLARGTTSADVEAYAFLQQRADSALLRQLERPSYSVETARQYGEALTSLASQDDVALVYLGNIPQDDAYVLADIADFCLGLDEITWAIAAGVIGDDLVLTIRNLGGKSGAGDLAKALVGPNGNGGGHATMARAALKFEGEWKDAVGQDRTQAAESLLGRICGYLQPLRVSRRSSRPARPATDR